MAPKVGFRVMRYRRARGVVVVNVDGWAMCVWEERD